MRKFQTIYLDMDGVLADFHTAALIAHKKPEWNRDNWPELGEDLQSVLGMKGQDKSVWLPKFWEPINAHPTFWEEYPIFPWAQELIELCREYVTTPHGLVICSSPASSCKGEDKRQKLRWLAKHGINLEVKFTEKKHELSKLDTLLIDDWEKQVDPFRRLGHGRSILFPQPWNRNAVEDWIEKPLHYVRHWIEYYTDRYR